MKLLAFLALIGLVTSQQIPTITQSQGTIQVGPVRFDTEPVMREMDYWSKWIGNPQVQNQAAQASRGLEDAFNQAKLRLEINGASIFRPVLRSLELVKDHKMLGEHCDIDAMFQCYLAQQKQATSLQSFNDFEKYLAHMKDMELLNGTCAKAHKCQPDVSSTQNFGEQYRSNNTQSLRAAQKLGQRIQGDTARAMQAYQGQVGQIVQGYAATANKIMKEVYECDPQCSDQFTRRVFFNPIDAMHQCNCKNPIQMDMSSQYLFRSPDVELYKLMNVDTSDYKVNDQIFRKQSNELTQLSALPLNIDVFDTFDGMLWQTVKQGQDVTIKHDYNISMSLDYAVYLQDNFCNDGKDYDVKNWSSKYVANDPLEIGSGGNMVYNFTAPKEVGMCELVFHRESDNFYWTITIVTEDA